MTNRVYCNRRRFLAGSAGAMGAAIFGRLPLEAMAQETSPAGQEWDAGLVRHILPTVSDSRILLKVSFDRPLSEAPTLRIGTSAFPGKMSDTAGEYWQFHAGQLQPDRPYTL